MRLARLRPYLKLGLVATICINLVFLGAYVWGRDGQTTVVEFERVDGAYGVRIDGTRVDFEVGPEDFRERAELDAPEEGSVRLVPVMPLSSFPNPSGIDSVVVLGPSGEELFRDDFDTLDEGVWNVDSGAFDIASGVLVPQDVNGANSITLRDRSWQGDYTVSVTYRNNRGGVIGTHVAADGGAFYQVELIRDFPNFIDANRDGQLTGRTFGEIIQTDSGQVLKSIAYMLTEPYPYAVLGLLAGTALILAISLVPRAQFRRFSGVVDLVNRPWVLRLSVLAVVGFAFSVTLGLNWHYYAFLPHIPDEVLYVFQARLLAAGRFTTEVPEGLPVDTFYLFVNRLEFLNEIGEWASFYPFGHPLLLAIGSIFGAMWVVPSAVGAGSVFLTYAVGRYFYNVRTALLAAAFLAVSPFFLIQSSNFLSHSTCTLYILASLLFILKRDRPLLYGVLAGIMFGLGVNTRPLNMLVLVLPYGGLMLGYLFVKQEALQSWLKHTGAFVLATLFMVVLMFAYTYGVTGEALSVYGGGTFSDSSELYGFRDGHNLNIGIRNQQAQVTTLLEVFNAWPAFAGIIVVAVPFLLATRNRWDYFCLLCVALPILAYVGYRYSSVLGGPRYWYEAMPFLVLLAARGVEMAGAMMASLVQRLRERLGREPDRPVFAGRALVYGVVAALVIWGSGGWLLSLTEPQDSPNVPTRADALDGFFGVDNRMDRLANRLELENALVLVKPCGFFQSPFCYGTVFVRNSLDLDGDIVWARYIEGMNEQIVAGFPGREVYVANWDDGASLEPYDPAVHR